MFILTEVSVVLDGCIARQDSLQPPELLLTLKLEKHKGWCDAAVHWTDSAVIWALEKQN